MSYNNEQLGRSLPTDFAIETSKPDWYHFNKNSKRRTYVKRITSKFHRRQAKFYLEDAQPRNKYNGWND